MWQKFLAALNIRRSEMDRFLFCYVVCFLLHLALTIGGSVAEALFLTRLGVGSLPMLFLVSSGVNIAGTIVYSIFSGRIGIERLFLVVVSGSCVTVATLIPLLYHDLRIAYWLVYVGFVASTSILNVSVISYAAAHFTVLEAKRLIAPITTGSTVGALIGGALVGTLVEYLPVIILLALACVIEAGCGVLVYWGFTRIKRLGLGVAGEESSENTGLFENVREGVRYLQRSRLALSLGVGSFFLAATYRLAEFQYSDIFTQRFPSADDLAGFIGWVLSGINLLEIVIGLAVTPYLLKWMGVPSTTLIFPFTTLLAFVGLSVSYTVPAGAVARFNTDTVESVVRDPSISLIYGGIPARLRVRLQGFIEGTLAESGTWMAALFLLAVQASWSHTAISVVGLILAAAAIYAYAGFRKEYAMSLMRRLKEGDMDRDAAVLALAGASAQLEEAVQTAVSEGDERTVILVCDLAARHELQAFGLPLARLLPALSSRAATAVLGALEVIGTDACASFVEERALVGPPEVRAAALGCLRRIAPLRALTIARSRWVSSTGAERTEAAACLAEEGETPERAEAERVLEETERWGPTHARVEMVRALARSAGFEHSRWTLRLLADSELAVRLEAVSRLVIKPERDEIRRQICALALNVSQPVRLRVIAIGRIGHAGTPSEVDALIHLLGDSHRKVREAAVSRCAEIGESVTASLISAVRSDSEPRAEAAARALALSSLNLETLSLIQSNLLLRLREAHEAVLYAGFLGADRTDAARFMIEAFQDYVRAVVQRTLSILEAMDAGGRLHVAVRWIRSRDLEAHDAAVELLINVCDQEVVRLVVPLLEAGSDNARMEASRRILGFQRVDRDWLVQKTREHRHRWIRLAALVLERDSMQLEAGMKELMLLKKVSLFNSLSLDQIEAIRAVCVESIYLKGEVIFREGSEGHHLYILLSGMVEVVKGHGSRHSTSLAVLKEGDYFGELSIIDSQERSATAAVLEDARVLTLERNQFEQLLYDIPDVAMEICKGLTRHLRQTDERLVAFRAAPARGIDT